MLDKNKHIIKYYYLFYKVNSSYFKTIKNKWIGIFKKSLSIVSFLSLTIVTGIGIFIIGRIGIGNVSDDDLIMQNIKKQLPENLIISNIYLEDIHGFGNNSIIILAVNNEKSQLANQLLIYDKIDNNILNQFNNLFGYGSNYKLNYKFSLQDSYYDITEGYYLEIVDCVDLTGDLSKEIIVQFMPYPAGNGAYYCIGIFSYSYEKHIYKLIGTYPPSKLYEKMEGINIISTVFHEGEYYQNNYYNKDEQFTLEYGSKYNNDFFAESKIFGTILIRTERIWGDEGNADPHRFIISMFQAVFDSNDEELKWEILFSKETDEYIDYCSKEYVQKFLESESPLWEIILD